jgi:hypothetical protein
MNSFLPPTVTAVWFTDIIYSYLQLVAVFTLVSLLIQRELTINSRWWFLQFLRRVLLIGIVPLFVVFVMILAWNVGNAS